MVGAIALIEPFVMVALTMLVASEVPRPRTMVTMPRGAAVGVVDRHRQALIVFLFPPCAALRACRAMLAGLVIFEPDALFDQAGGDVGHSQARGETQARHLDQVSQWVADTARKFNIWFVVMAQVNQTENIRGGEGMRLAFDQVFQIHRDPDGLNPDAAWLEMLETRHTRWINVGSEDRPGLIFNSLGPMFEPVPPEPQEQLERTA